MPQQAVDDGLRREIEALITAARRISPEVSDQVDRVFNEARTNPLSREEAVELLTTVITVLRSNAANRANGATAAALADGDLIGRLLTARDRVRQLATAPAARPAPARLDLLSRNGVTAGALHPTPLYHGTRVQMNHGFVKLTDMGLWDQNDRLDIHLRQFQQQHGRRPNRDELLQIMLSEMPLLGVTHEDQFQIVALAHSISVNGVRKPPILDLDGTPLDGNRRIAACFYILNNPDDFDDEERRRVEYLYVWQLTEHATPEDKRTVVVSLNFESDCKMEWPAYVKARRVYEEWQAMKLREPRAGAQRVREMLVELSKRYALGPNPATVKRYLKMVDLADEFADYHVNDRGRDRFEVEHQANRYFEYFDELSKGVNPGGVAHTLNQNEPFKHLVYDLLFQDKFASFKEIRDLKYMDDEVRENLVRAAEMPTTTADELDEAQDLVERTLTDARNRNRQNRVGNPNIRIHTFVQWLEDLPLSVLRQELRPDVRQELRDALELVTQVMDFVPQREEEGE